MSYLICVEYTDRDQIVLNRFSDFAGEMKTVTLVSWRISEEEERESPSAEEGQVTLPAAPPTESGLTSFECQKCLKSVKTWMIQRLPPFVCSVFSLCLSLFVKAPSLIQSLLFPFAPSVSLHTKGLKLRSLLY